MSELIPIDSERAFADFIDAVDHFHDALLHEVVILHPGYVTKDRGTVGDNELPNARLVFQSPFDDILAVQLDLRRVSIVALDFCAGFDWKVELKPRGVRFFSTGYSGQQHCEIQAEEVAYRLLGREARGPVYQMIREEVLVDDLFFNAL